LILAMLEISKKTDYGLELARILAENYDKGPVSLKQLAKKENLPYRFLGQVVIPLKEAGIIEAKEGTNGGYFLKRKPKDISLADLIKALEGSVNLCDCVDCQRTVGCRSKNFWKEIEKNFIIQMERKSLADLI